MSFKKNDIKKQRQIIQTIKESQTLDKKHKEIVKNFQTNKNKDESIEQELVELNNELFNIEKNRSNFNYDIIKKRAE